MEEGLLKWEGEGGREGGEREIGERERQTDRQKDRQTDRHRDRERETETVLTLYIQHDIPSPCAHRVGGLTGVGPLRLPVHLVQSQQPQRRRQLHRVLEPLEGASGRTLRRTGQDDRVTLLELDNGARGRYVHPPAWADC